MSEPRALYVHVPFCKAKCHYCDFVSVPFDARLAKVYIEAMAADLAQSTHGMRPETVYIGGGTPTVLELPLLEELLGLVGELVDTSAILEFTVEANPGTLDTQKLQLLHENGVNRLSLGIQTFDDDLLGTLGRCHSADEALKGYELARATFGNISIDLIYAIPGQTLTGWQNDLDTAADLAPEHVSAYCLSCEEGTILAERVASGELALIDDDTAAEMYASARRRLSAAGLAQYEISNFARSGRACRQNIIYWRNEPYVGVGSSAASYDGRKRSTRIRDVVRYTAAFQAGESVVESEEELPPLERAGETLMLALRMNEGITADEFASRTDCDLVETFGAVIDRHVTEGFLSFESGRLALTEKGMPVADSILADFVG